MVWLEAPPGAGKTTLVTCYQATTGMPSLWYRVDTTDNDIGSFFHHMSLAACAVTGRSDLNLPRFGPEYAGGKQVFTRNFFRQLFDKVPRGLLILDDYHEVGEESPLHEIAAIGMTELPPGMNAIVLSRSAPPKEFARLQSTRSLERIHSSLFSLTEEETAAICRAFCEAYGIHLTAKAIAGLHRRCGGWVTGLILMLEANRIRGFPLELDDAPLPPVVFDYFASEIFGTTDADTERVLLSTAMLEEITADLAVVLSGVEDAADRLDVLSGRGYFTVRHESRTPRWTYHQLFREFLMRQAATQLGGARWTSLQSTAAEELVRRGEIEQAIMLYRRLRDSRNIVLLLSTSAPTLLAQGRHESVAQWFDALPEEEQGGAPWALYWSACARMQFDPTTARQHFERASQRFREDGDAQGVYLAWAMSVQCILFEQSDFGILADKIREVEELRQSFEYPDETVEAAVFASLTTCVYWHCHDHPSRDQWLDRALELQAELPDLTFRILYLSMSHAGSIYAGEISRRRQMLELLRSLADMPSLSPLALNTLKCAESFDYAMHAEFESSIETHEAGLSAARASGVVLVVPIILSGGAADALTRGDLPRAQRCITQMEEVTAPHRRQEYGFLLFLRGWEACVRKDWNAASEWFERGDVVMEKLRAPVLSSCSDVMRGLVCHHLGETEESVECLRRARERAGVHGRLPLFALGFVTAEIASDSGRATEALEALSESLAIGRESGYRSFLGWRREAMSRLCAEALASDIEVPYTLSLIEKHKMLPPEGELLDLRRWPWPVVVRSLGGFELSISGEQVRFSSKAPRKPLQLLELLILRGGVQVPESWLADALWPEAEGDDATNSLSTTIQRLRRLLKVNGLLTRQNRHLTLDRRRCWVDVWALEDELRHLIVLDDIDAIGSAVDRALVYCAGTFMPHSELDETLRFRRELLQRTLDILDISVQRIETSGECQRAVALRKRIGLLRAQVAYEL